MWRNNHVKVRELNDRLMMAERAFTDRDGLLRRPWYKHLVSFPYLHSPKQVNLIVLRFCFQLIHYTTKLNIKTPRWKPQEIYYSTS